MRVPAFMNKPPATGPSREFHFPRPVPLSLEHGASGFLIPRGDLPLVHLRVTLRSGITADPARRIGVAYGVSQMLDEGAGQRNPIQVSADLMQIGAGFSTWAEGDSSAVSLHVLSKHLERGLDLLSDILTRPHLRAEEWTRGKEELMDRAIQRRAQPAALAQLGLKAMIFGAHPYGRPILPLPDQLAKIRAADLQRFHRTHFHPRNALVVAAGAVSAHDLSARLNSRLAAWAPGRGRPLPVREIGPELQRQPRAALRHRPAAAQSVLAVGHLGPDRRTEDFIGLKVLNTLLGGSFTSRLNQNLRERHGYTYGVYSDFEFSRESGLFAVQTAVSTEDTAAALEQIFHELRQLTRTLVGREELSKACELVLQDIPRQAESLSGLVSGWSDLLFHELELDYLSRFPREVAALTPGRLRSLARRYLHPDQARVVVVGDGDRVGPALQRAYGPLLLLDADGQPTAAC